MFGLTEEEIRRMTGVCDEGANVIKCSKDNVKWLVSLKKKLDKGLITEAHKFALFLSLQSRKLKFLSSEEREPTLDIIKERMAVLKVNTPVHERAAIASSAFVFEEEDEMRENDELNEYVKRKNQFPTLYQIAVETLSIPGSSASAERSFLKLKRLISDERTSPNFSTISTLMLGYQNYQK
uniref:Dimer_Tnp_hAT domain-containing protein n=1 Tax=Rhabditophanes sp. KR3021 TaxID=114890 RepID=A0AC35U9F9_9BILA